MRLGSALEGELLAELRRMGGAFLVARALFDLLGRRHDLEDVRAALDRLFDDGIVMRLERAGQAHGYTLTPAWSPSFRILDADDRGRPTLFACQGCRTTWPTTTDTESSVLAELTAHRCEGDHHEPRR